ncbi:DNA mismatch repair endonuclease MutL [Psychromonas aquatilis]|uniref:DNA mismatch repair protein MutL n=1 Tax=Psychromonas aquatilis TaxID=2005072 RepID=A0ABU9GRW3_9GAMM
MSIQILPARLANQIAAGEVVERPASVVKELVENSLDAGATRIDIEIEQGGAKCIRIKDNGSGVNKEQLTLALSRHATSKISHLDDLEAIVSLGFRGEALASVSSVARLTFTSKPADQDEAWQAIAEGRDMQVHIQPAAHPQGTTVEVLDLFFNTPARRRFLKTEKTEFQHIDELIKRIALSRFDIAISLKHNNKIVRQYRAAPTQQQQEKRIAAICSEQFIQNAVFFEHQDQALKISGWVSDRLSPRPLADVQYCYINGRMIRDKLVNHAIKQVFAYYLPQGTFPGYIIYIECDPKEVDVNVHPAKHEVRFHQARWVHDFISSTLNTTLNDSSLVTESTPQAPAEEHTYQPPTPSHHDYEQASTAPATSAPSTGGYSREASKPFQKPALDHGKVAAYCDFVAEAYQHNVTATPHLPAKEANQQAPANVLSLIKNKIVLIQPLATPLTALSDNGLLLLSVTEANKQQLSAQLFSAWEDGEVISQPLLLPVRFEVDESLLAVAKDAEMLLTRLGFVYKFKSKFIIVSQVPAAYRHAPIASILPSLFEYLGSVELFEEASFVKLVCEQLGQLFILNNDGKVLSVTEVLALINSLIKLPTQSLQACFKQPDLSLLIKETE